MSSVQERMKKAREDFFKDFERHSTGHFHTTNNGVDETDNEQENKEEDTQIEKKEKIQREKETLKNFRIH
ncbi:hypothetical protein JTB14_008401 [Gonioctena quinquepunctata]|nr:hypothetical protein JTB14_008401 [Gonioctena quinquepunctata]